MTTSLEENSGASTLSETSPVPGADQKVDVGPPGAWVIERDLDKGYRPNRTGPYTVLLLDRQHNASLQCCFLRQVHRLETLHAVHEASQWKLDFYPQSQRVTIHSIALLRGEERIEQATLERFRFLQREAGLEQLVLDGAVTVMALIEDVRLGDILDVRYTIETKSRILPNRYSAFGTLTQEVPVRAYYFSVRFPTGHAMRRRCVPVSFEPVEREIDGDMEWTWTVEYSEARERDPGLPAWYSTGRQIQISDCESWSEVAAAVEENWQECFDDAVLEKTVHSIAVQASTQSARAELALRMVQDDIRYLSNNIELGGQIPTSPAVVLRQRFGDCKDKSFLLAHLFRRLGISARPVLVNTLTGRMLDQLLPTPQAFNHVVIEYEIDGERRTVDATTPVQGGGPLKRGIPNFGFGLPIGPGVTELEPLAALPESQDFYQLREVFYLNTAGAAPRLKMEITAQGQDADGIRRNLAVQGAEAVSLQHEQLYRHLFPEVRRIGTLDWIDDREKNEIILEEVFELPHVLMMTPERDGYLFQCRAHLVQSILGFPDLKQKAQPLALRYPCHAEHLIEIESGGLGKQEYETHTKRDSAFRFSCEAQSRAGRWTMRFRLQTFRDEVSARDFDSFKRHVQELWPHTYVHVFLPPGIMPSRRQLSSSGLSQKKNRASGSDASNDSSAQNSPVDFLALLPLPTAPAPALTSVVGAKTVSAPPAETPARRTKTASPTIVKPKVSSETPGENHDTNRSHQPSSSRRRRRRRRSSKRRLWLALSILTFVSAVVLWYLMFSHR